MSITIKEVAEVAGVSRTTISFYLNGKFEYMSEETKEKIRKVIEELDYKPNSVAQGLKTKKSGLIGMIVADITNPFTSILVKGVNDMCIEKGYQLLVVNTDNNSKNEREYIKSILQRQAEGIIINSTGDNIDLLKELKDKGAKIVLADRTVEGKYFDSVTTNNEEITFSTIDMMYKNGFEEIAFFTYPLNVNSTRVKRFQSFAKASKKYSKIGEEYLYVIEKPEDMTEKVKAFVNKYKDKKKAVFVVNGVVMLNLIQAVFELGLSIPRDIGICGFDDWGWNTVIGSGISAISQPSYEVGRKCTEILIRRISNEISEPESINLKLKSQLILRGSTRID